MRVKLVSLVVRASLLKPRSAWLKKKNSHFFFARSASVDQHSTEEERKVEKYKATAAEQRRRKTLIVEKGQTVTGSGIGESSVSDKKDPTLSFATLCQRRGRRLSTCAVRVQLQPVPTVSRDG